MNAERQYALVVGVALAAFAAALFVTESLALGAVAGVAAALVARRVTEEPAAVRESLPQYALGAVAAVVAGGLSQYGDADVEIAVANAVVWGAAVVYLAATWRAEHATDGVGFLTNFAAVLPLVVLAGRLPESTFALVLGTGLLWLSIGVHESES